MAKTKYRNKHFSLETERRIDQIVEIVEDYQQQGLKLTARQLYYQFVSKGLIPNKDSEYKRLTALLTDARYAGLVDWAAIEDRGREPSTPSDWNTPAELIESALRAYRLPRWTGQDKYVELWVEKQALAGVLAPIAREFHATLMVNKGYGSASSMKESADRIRENAILDKKKFDRTHNKIVDAFDEHGKDSDEFKAAAREMKESYRTPVVLYLGDHDPSGEDMVRDISDRLKEFKVYWLEVEKVALTSAQVRQYNPPPNPAKITDPRAAGYIAKHGNHSWEVDALPPQVLTQLIRAAFRRHVDTKKMNDWKQKEETDKQLLREAVAGIMEKR
jgi:hypothetical protein